MFYLSPQVKGSAIISNKHGIYELSHELPNDLIKTLEIWKYQENLKTSWNYNLVPSLHAKMKMLLIIAKNC